MAGRHFAAKMTSKSCYQASLPPITQASRRVTHENEAHGERNGYGVSLTHLVHVAAGHVGELALRCREVRVETVAKIVGESLKVQR